MLAPQPEAESAKVGNATFRSPPADTRVEPAVRHIDQQVHQEVHRRDQHRAEHHRIVPVEDRLHHQPAQAGPAEDRLHDERAAEQMPQVQPQHGGHRNQGVAQHVAPHHSAAENPLARAVRM